MGDTPYVAVVDDCVYRPFSSKVFFDRDPSWGIYDSNGFLVPEAAYRRGAHLALVGQSQVTATDDEDIEKISDSCVYFGPLIPHYGHFIVSSLARAWFLKSDQFQSEKLICHSDFAPDQQLAGNFMGQIMNGLGLRADQFIAPKKSVRFDRLVIPGPAFIEQKLAYGNFLAPMHSIGDAFLMRGRSEFRSGVAYLSKSQLEPPAVAKLTNEHLVEDMLKQFGVDIYYPEKMNLSEQIQLFASYEHIIGFAGSAFHTHIFVRDPPRMTCVTYDPFVNSNFLMLDKLNQAKSEYFYPDGDIVPEQTPGFAVSRSLVDPKRFVDEFLDLAQIATRGTFVGHAAVLEKIEMSDSNCVADHVGESYRDTLVRLHRVMNPKAYLEIGTLTGGTLSLSSSPSIAIDPRFQVSDEVIGKKPLCLFYQLPSDVFFERYDPRVLLGSRLELSFLDGMHRCEYLLRDFINTEMHSSSDGVIVLHDCLPVEIPMTDRTQNGTPPVMPHRGGWWTGDVWRTVLLLKRRRPDLKIISLDAAPTGLILVCGLNPYSTVLKNNYSECVAEMFEMDLEQMTIKGFMDEMNVESTSLFTDEATLEGVLRRT